MVPLIKREVVQSKKARKLHSLQQAGRERYNSLAAVTSAWTEEKKTNQLI